MLGSQLGSPLFIQLPQSHTGNLDLALARQIKSRKQAQQGRFTGAGSTDQRHCLSLLDFQIYPLKYGQRLRP